MGGRGWCGWVRAGAGRRTAGRSGRKAMDREDVTERVLGAAIEVHRALGPGLLESTYEACLALELAERGVRFERQVGLPVLYRGLRLECGYRVDLIVEETVVVEVKSVDRLHPVHDAQLLTYLKLSGVPIGLLLNFNVPMLKEGIRRFIRWPGER